MSRTRYKTTLLIHCGSDIICRETYHIMTLCTSNTCSHSCHVPLARTAASHSFPNRPWASLYPPPLAGGFYPMVISGYLDHQSTQFRLSASELLLFVSMVLVLINALYGIPNCDDPVSYQLIYYDKKGHFHTLFYCLNSLICCSFPFLFVLNVSLLLGTADAEILGSPLLKPQSWRMFSLKSME